MIFFLYIKIFFILGSSIGLTWFFLSVSFGSLGRSSEMTFTLAVLTLYFFNDPSGVVTNPSIPAL